MDEPHTYKIVELVGSSPDGVDAAITNALGRANKTLRNLDWFEVRQIRGTSVNQVPDVTNVVVTAGTAAPTSGMVLSAEA